ncbi:PREDICTED: putative pentatricopeptide repeat-containing protein At5g52630 [Camelina sativa]|uniref:Pentatricopeptide repeat-containing protein At5g52630 n=1 Tax=Camelina sativa TaxID=90675 RepID=A0ABM0SML7_CAMSA|nr:PREDICTED: putative pentatricopeptide repeat-containing protein At5g52630 [Camelina sativa]
MHKLNIRSFRLHLKPFSNYIHSNADRTKLQSNLVLGDLSKSGRVNEARQVFDKMPERDEFTWNTMIVAYSKSGRLSDADQIFRSNPVKNTISWNALISGYCKHGHEDEAFGLFWEMQFDGIKPNEYTLGSVLRLCTWLALLLRGEEVHGHTIKTGFDLDVNVVNGLLAMYAQCKRISEAEYLFGSMSGEKNNVTWTSMLTGYSQNGFAFRAIECFRDLTREGNQSNQFTFPSVLTACASVSARRVGVQVHGCIVKSGFKTNIYVQSALIDMYAKCRDLETARDLLEGMEADDVVSWNSMIVGCVRQGLIEEGLSFFGRMHERDMKIDDFTIPSILNCFALSRTEIKIASSAHCLIVKTGYGTYKLVNNALVDMYAKRGIMDSALKVFEGMIEKDVISWTALVTGNTHNRSYEEALKLFCNMRVEGISPDQIVTASVLSASAELTLLEFGQQVHGNYIKSGFPSSLSVNNSLVTMYTKCGSLDDANVIFNSMEIRDLITWTALIVGYAKNGKAKDSLELYYLMIGSGITPDYITFIGLLFACSHAGLIEEAQSYFDSMRTVYGIRPGPEHYACMIDLFGRSGDFVKVEELLSQMEVEPDATVWKAILAASRKHGNIENGERAAKTLMELEPNNAVPYVLLSNMYAAAGRQDEAANVRRLMKSRNISKEPGCSWVEEKGKVHSFMSEDRRHPRMVEIYAKVDEMMLLIKEAGYIADMSFALHDLDKEGKELGLAYHSEKLAVAFGLLVVPYGAPIRIIKNLRVCGDCHNAMKYISRVYLRHIILRDSNCFHHFRDGNCSCVDYW